MRYAIMMQEVVWPRVNAMAKIDAAQTKTRPAARPSSPSEKFTALTTPAIHKGDMISASQPIWIVPPKGCAISVARNPPQK